jgi:hypothetical protein
MSKTSAICLLCLLLLSGCVNPPPPLTAWPGVTDYPIGSAPPSASTLPVTTVSTPVSTIQPGAESTSAFPGSITPLPTSTPPRIIPAEYSLNVVFDYVNHTLLVAEQIQYTNLSADQLASLDLIVEPNLIPGGFTLKSMAFTGGDAIDSYTLDKNLLQVSLPIPLQPGEILGISLDYGLQIPQISDPSFDFHPIAYGYSDMQTNLVDWYVYLPPYQSGEGWLVHPPWGFGEYQVYDAADFNVRISLAEQVPGLVIAASAPAHQAGDNYSYHLESARTFAWSASTEFVVQTTEVDKVTILSYTFPYDKAAGQQVLQNTADALRLYSQLFFAYPHSTLSVVEADFLDGMEYDGLYFLSHGFYSLYDGTPKGYLTFIAAHETAHQWWYGLVGNDQAVEPWLDEALCTYMERIFCERYDANSPPHSGGSLADWWWDYRINFYEPGGWVNAAIYDFDNSLAYRNAVYLNGAIFLQDLRTLIGDQAFFAALRDYASTNQHSIATADDFFASLKRHTSLDVDKLLADYFQYPQ